MLESVLILCLSALAGVSSIDSVQIPELDYPTPECPSLFAGGDGFPGRRRGGGTR